MRKFLKLSLLTAVFTLIMSAGVWAAENIQTDTTLVASSYEDITVNGDVTITIPEGGTNVSTVLGVKPCITIQSGKVTIKGAEGASSPVITYSGEGKAASLIQINSGAELTLENVTIDGSNKEFYDGVTNMGTLNITNGTVIRNFNNIQHSRMGGGVFTQGTFNMTGGEITGNTFSYGSGGGLVVVSGTATISGGTIHDNTVNSVYHSGGTLDITGGLIAGQTNAKYNNTGLYKGGNIVTETGGTVFDGTDNISVTANNGTYLIANPSHDIYATISEEKYVGSYFSGEWHFVKPTSNNQQIDISTNEIILSTYNNKASISATIISDDPAQSNVTWGFDENAANDIVTLAPVDGSPNVCEIVAQKAGTTKILATDASHQTKSEVCTITVKESKKITSGTTLSEVTEYTDTVIDPGAGNSITVTIGTSGITVNNTTTNESAISDCITVKSGNVTISGGPIYFNPLKYSDGTIITTDSIIKVEDGATLTINNKIYGKNKDGVQNTVLYGINNLGNLNINAGAEITGVQADSAILEDAIVNNSGVLTIDGGRIYDNTDGYAIQNVYSGTTTVNSGAVVGTLYYPANPEYGNGFDVTPDSVCKAGIVYGEGFSSVTIDGQKYSVVPNETGVIADPAKITNDLNHTGIHSAGRWDFEDKTINPNLSYVRGTSTSIPSGTGATEKSTFANTHITDNLGTTTTSTPEDRDDIFSVSTGFYDTVTPIDNTNLDGSSDTNEYILVDIIFGSNNIGYIKSDTGATNPLDTSFGKININSTAILNDNTKALYKAQNPSERIIKVKFNIEKDANSKYGIIIDNLYSPESKAYIRACTKTQYDADADYTEVADTAGVAVVSLES